MEFSQTRSDICFNDLLFPKGLKFDLLRWQSSAPELLDDRKTHFVGKKKSSRCHKSWLKTVSLDTLINKPRKSGGGNIKR